MDNDQFGGIQCLGKIKQFLPPFEYGESAENGVNMIENIGCVDNLRIGGYILWNAATGLKSLIPCNGYLLKTDIEIFGKLNRKRIIDG